jgi:hypothetical protein
MSVADYYLQKCTDAIAEDAALLLAKLSNPASLVDVNVTGALTEASSLGDLASLAGDYISNNASALTMAVVGATSLNKNSPFSALNAFMNMLANSVSAYNDMILIYVKKIAKQIVEALNKKIAINQTVQGDITALVNTLISMNQGPKVFDAYLTQLRAALILVDQGRRDIQLTTNTLQSQSFFLTKTFRKGKKEMAAAQKLIKPLAKNPYLNPTIKSVALNLGIPDSSQQIGNILALPKLCHKIISDVSNYGTVTLLANAQLSFYASAVAILIDGLPNILKQQLLSMLNQTLQQINSLEVSMANVLNGNPGAVAGPVNGFIPVPLKVSVNAYKWMMDINLIVNALKVIPADIVVVPPQINGTVHHGQPNILYAGSAGLFNSVSLGDTVSITGGTIVTPGDYIVMVKGAGKLTLDRAAYVPKPGAPIINLPLSPNDVQYSIITDGALSKFQLSQGPVIVYEQSVALIAREGNRRSGSGLLLAKEGQENFAYFQEQLIGLMTEAMVGVASTSVRTSAIAEGQALIEHCNLSMAQDREIIGYLTTFINTPIPLEDTLNQIEAGLAKLLKDLGLDKASDALAKGDFKSLLGMNGKNATYIGAALETLAFLKQCFPDQTSLNKFIQIENSIKGDQNLLNVKVSFNFDLAIFKNLAACTDFTNLANLFNSKEFLCALAGGAGLAAQAAGSAVASTATTAAGAISSGAGSAFSALSDMLSFPDSPPSAVNGVPAAPSNVVPDAAAASIAAKAL